MFNNYEINVMRRSNLIDNVQNQRQFNNTNYHYPNYFYNNVNYHPNGMYHLPINYGHNLNHFNNNNYTQVPSGGHNSINPELLFSNPLQPNKENTYLQSFKPNNYNMNNFQSPQMLGMQQGGIQTFMNSFKNNDGTIDFNKMINTAGSMMNAVSQFSSVVKGFTSMFSK